MEPRFVIHGTGEPNPEEMFWGNLLLKERRCSSEGKAQGEESRDTVLEGQAMQEECEGDVILRGGGF